MEFTKEHAIKVLELVDVGLVKGLGVPEPGKMCIEAAFCFALGLPHGDNPPHVSRALRAFKIRLNDANWSSNAARAKGMRELAIAQVGSDLIDDRIFTKMLTEETIRKIIPLCFREVTKVMKEEKHKLAMLAAADKCEKEGTRASAVEAGDAADAAYTAAAGVYDAGVYNTACTAAYTAAAAASEAADLADVADKDMYLSLAASIAVTILKKLGTVGCQWLDLVGAD